MVQGKQRVYAGKISADMSAVGSVMQRQEPCFCGRKHSRGFLIKEF
jgi:hypothetical protein